MPPVDILSFSLLALLAIAFGFVVRNYAKGLAGSPRELWLLYGYKLVETTAYAITLPTLILSIKKDGGLNDIDGSNYMLAFSIATTIFVMMVGAFTDTVGIKRMTLVSIGILFIARIGLGLTTSPALLFLVGFLPLAAGIAIVFPVVSVGVKKYTTKESSTMGFALFYIVMNLGFAIGGHAFDVVRSHFAQRNAAGVIIDENAGAMILGAHFSTYKIIFLLSTVVTLLSLLLILPMREKAPGIESDAPKPDKEPEATKPAGILASVANSFRATGSMLAASAKERYFWVFLGLVTLILFVQAVNRHFSLTFPDYGIRVLGQGAKIGSVYGVLNPVLIIFLVPIVAAFTSKVSSYKLMTIGSAVSTLACFLILLPAQWFDGLTRGFFGEIIFCKWLHIAPDAAALAQNPPSPVYWPLIIFITVFTIGEALWSPRFYQFTTEIAPKGKEATYLSLSMLPSFASKFIVTAMSGRLLDHYTPVDAAGKVLPHENHAMVWVWIGVSAAITPVGLLLCRGWFRRETEKHRPFEA